jgi:hypothetical protein
MAGLYDDDDDLLSLLDSAPDAAPVSAPGLDESDVDALSVLLEDAVAAKSGGPSMEIGEITLGTPAEEPAPAATPAPAPKITVPEPKQAANLVMSESPEGKQQPFGVRDERADLMAARDRVRELSRGQPAEVSGPGEQERAFAASSWRPSDQDVRRAWIIQSLFGDKGDAFRMVEMLRGIQRDHDEGLARARGADQQVAAKNRRVNPAVAEMAALSGISPESAVGMTGDDAKVLQSLGGLGVRLRGQDTQVLNKNVGETGDVLDTLITEEGKNTRHGLQLENNIEVANIRKRQGKGGGGGGSIDPTELQAFLERQENVSPDKVAQFVSGTLDRADPDFARLSSAAVLYQRLDSKKRAQVVAGALGREAGNVDAPEKSAAVKQADPVKRMEIKNELNEVGIPLQRALKSWQRLPPNVKKLATSIGLEGNIGKLKQLGFTDQQAADFARVIGQINEDIKRTAGSAVSANEGVRKGAEIGITMDGIAPMSPAVLTNWLSDKWSNWQAKRRSAEEVYGPLWGKGQ